MLTGLVKGINTPPTCVYTRRYFGTNLKRCRMTNSGRVSREGRRNCLLTMKTMMKTVVSEDNVLGLIPFKVSMPM